MSAQLSSNSVSQLQRLARRLHISNNIATGILWVVTLFVALAFISIIVRLVAAGAAYLIDPAFYSGNGNETSVGAQLFNTFYILILSEVILIPVSLAAAIYLIEYARKGRLVTFIHFAAETLAGVPSIVLGLFGFLLFGSVFEMGVSRLSGAMTLLCLNFPIALRLFEDALETVPRDQREGSLSLGSTRWHMVRTVVLPGALPGIVTGIVLTAGKIVGEAAALIFTMGSSNPANVFSLDPFLSTDTLTIRVWFVQTIGAGQMPLDDATRVAAGSSGLLIIILLLINVVARAVGRFIQRRVTAA
jgi:phosphate transport system permease protein